MFPANLGQVYRKDPKERPWDAWVIHIADADRQAMDREIRERHSSVENQLSAQQVNFVEITTGTGRNEFLRRFGCASRQRPIFAVLSRHPDDHKDGDLFLVIEWGALANAAAVAKDLMTLVQFFAQARFRDVLADASTRTDWSRIQTFIQNFGLRHLVVGDNVQVETFVDPEEDGEEEQEEDGADERDGATARRP